MAPTPDPEALSGQSPVVPPPQSLDAAESLPESPPQIPIALPSRLPPPEPISPPMNAARRILVRDASGQTVVARVHGSTNDRTVALLPDGQLGWPNRLVYTEAPFRPATADELRRTLSEDPYRGFEVRQTKHYLIFYRSSVEFAAASAQLLESLYDGLTGSLRETGLNIHEAEFPLVAVIFRTEHEFRAFKPVDHEVHAYYEIVSNRIFFYETSERDQIAPDLSARRKPQTVAHEGTHQILQNIGVQPRLAAWPIWLVEGLAEYCAPTTTRKGGEWARFGKINPFHMATLRDLQDPRALQGQGQGMTTPRIGRDPGQPMVKHLVTRTELTPTDYALAWALTHYLATKRFDEFVAYLKTMSRLHPLERRTPEEHLAAFRDAFGPDLGKMDKKILSYLTNLKNFESLPYYAVVFEQPMGGGLFRRGTLVSQSPAMIDQWLNAICLPQGDPPSWRAIPCPTKATALRVTEQWIDNR